MTSAYLSMFLVALVCDALSQIIPIARKRIQYFNQKG